MCSIPSIGCLYARKLSLVCIQFDHLTFLYILFDHLTFLLFYIIFYSILSVGRIFQCSWLIFISTCIVCIAYSGYYTDKYCINSNDFDVVSRFL